MASQSQGDLGEASSQAGLFRHARLYNFRKCLFQSPFTAPIEDNKTDPWVQVCNTFQVDMQVQAILNSSEKEVHQERLDKLKQELDYIKTDSWKYKPIEELIGF